MNILFIGQVVPEKSIDECTGYSVAGDMMQKNIINGLNQKDDVKITVISVMPNAAFPSDSIRIKKQVDFYNNVEITNISYINIIGVKQIFQQNSIYQEVKRKNRKQKYDLIMCFNMYPQFGNAAIKLQKKIGIPIVAILADIPLERAETYGGIKKLLFLPLKKNTLKNISSIKHGIILNKNVMKYMKKDSDCVVIPGGVNVDKNFSYLNSKVENKKVIYAGALSEYSGILNLIEAIQSLKIDGVTLEIYGSGVLKTQIEEISEKDKRIIYKGVKGIVEMRKIMEEAWILVNPRSVADPVSSVTFPSKLLEYIMCKRPVITTEFDGIPEEIKKITVGCGEGTSQEICNAINYINMLTPKEIEEFVEIAYDYVCKNMSWEKQADKIYKYIKKIEGTE